METEPNEPYVYQPYGTVTHPEAAESGRLWGVGLGGSPAGFLAQIKGLTKEEAAAVCRALKDLARKPPAETGG